MNTMVDKIIINKLLEDATTIVKCPSYYIRPSKRAEILSKLESFRDEDKKSLLANFSNPLEYREYLTTIDELNRVRRMLEKFKDRPEDALIKNLKQALREKERLILWYEKRLVDGSSPYDETREDGFNILSYDERRHYQEDDWENDAYMLENEQVRAEENSMDYDDNVLNALKVYFNEGSQYINGKVYDTHFFNKLKNNGELTGDYDKLIDNINEGIEHTVGVKGDTVFYTGIPFNIHLPVGASFKWDGFTSLSYSKRVAKSFSSKEYGHKRYVVKVFVKNGKKGFPANVLDLSNFREEHELLIGASEGKVIGYTDDMVLVSID